MMMIVNDARSVPLQLTKDANANSSRVSIRLGHAICGEKSQFLGRIFPHGRRFGNADP